MEIRNKRVLLTGASGGIGQAIAKALADQGAQLVLTGRNATALQKIADHIGGAEACIIADMASNPDLLRVLQEAGPVDILIANAGLPGTDEITNYSWEEIDQVLDVNLRAPMLLARGLISGMQARGGGHMVFMSSVAGKIASPLSSLYSASKYGLRGFADCLRLDLQDAHIGVSTIFPGMIRDAGMFAATGAKLPLGAPTNTPEEVAEAVVDAIRNNHAHVDVAGSIIRLGVHLAHFSPGLNGFLQRISGARKVARSFADGSRRRDKN